MKENTRIALNELSRAIGKAKRGPDRDAIIKAARILVEMEDRTYAHDREQIGGAA